MLFNDIRFNNELFNYDVSLAKGTIFKNDYSKYKNYDEKVLKFNNDKDNILLSIYYYDFCINDFNIYLDLHPEDVNIYNKFKECVNKLEYYVNLYESRYGSLDLLNTDSNTFTWYKDNWPFGGNDV